MEKIDKIVVLGASGLIGHKVFYNLKKNKKFRVYSVSKTTKVNADTQLIDLTNFYKLETFIKNLKPDFIVNCVGLLIEDSNTLKYESIILNALLPNHLHKISKKFNFRLIHISTDCVFSGNSISSYKECDLPDGLSNYAKTKSLGEINKKDALTIRTSVVGPQIKDGDELFHWFMKQSGEIKGYKKAFWSGVTTIVLAKGVEWAIINKISGIYNLTNGKKISKYDLLSLFKKHTNKKINIIPDEKIKTDKSFIDTRKKIDFEISNYDKMIEEMIIDINKNKKLYQKLYFSE